MHQGRSWWLVPSPGERLAMAGMVVVLGLVTFANQWGKFAPNTKPELYLAPAELFARSLSAWTPNALQAGQANFNTGLAPLALVMGLLRGIGLPAWLVVRVFRFGLGVVALTGMRRYYHAITGGRSTPAARVGAAAFYVANPAAIVVSVSLPVLLPYAVLPWLLLQHLRSLQRPRSWSRAAIFALTFAAMSGMNAGVVPIFLLSGTVAQAAALRLMRRRSTLDVARSYLRCGLLSGAVSLYWLLPSVLATGTGASIIESTEDPTSVAKTTSYAEVSRLLGNWPIYGRSGTRLFRPEASAYITSPIVVIATFAIPVAVLAALWVARRPVRVITAALLVIALPLMVGMFPPDDPPLFGRLVRGAFSVVPGAAAFRTTSKVAPLVALAFALALAEGVGWASLRVSGSSLRAPAGFAAALVVLITSYPAFSNDLYPSAWRVPGYWMQAAAYLNRGDPAARILVVPGTAGGNYRWGMRSPDEITASLLTRDNVTHLTVTATADPAANLMAGWDVPLNERALTPGAMSTYARTLGADTILVRNDTRYEEARGARPADVVRQLRADPGLRESRAFGRPGEYTNLGGSSALARSDDQRLSPLMVFRVVRPTTTVQARSAQGALLVDGDGAAIGDLTEAGLMSANRPLRLLGSIDPKELDRLARDGVQVVLTDQNRRRRWDKNKLGAAYSPVLRADESLAGPGPSLTLFPGRPSTQTVAVLRRVRRITATPNSFGLVPWGRPELAFDGNPATAWWTGTLGTAQGKQIAVQLDKPRRIEDVVVTVAPPRGTAQIRSLKVTAGKSRAVGAVVGAGAIKLRLQPTTATTVTVEITQTTKGLNEVGISEIAIPGAEPDLSLRLPTTYADLVRRSSPVTRLRLATLPLNVVLTRIRNDPATADDDEEATLNRLLELPDRRRFTVDGVVSSLADLSVGATDPRGCTVLATVDGRDLGFRSTGSAANGGVRVVACNEIELAAGTHRLRSAAGVTLDALRLSSPGTVASVSPDPPRARVVERTSTRFDVALAATLTDSYLSIGQAFSPGWSARVGRTSLGPPIMINGYAVGWRVPAGPPRRITVLYQPQLVARSALLVSALTAAAVGFIALGALRLPWGRRPRRRAR